MQINRFGYFWLDTWVLANVIQLTTQDFCTRYLNGHTEGKIVIRFASDDESLIGQIVKVKVTAATPLSIEGELE